MLLHVSACELNEPKARTLAKQKQESIAFFCRTLFCTRNPDVALRLCVCNTYTHLHIWLRICIFCCDTASARLYHSGIHEYTCTAWKVQTSSALTVLVSFRHSAWFLPQSMLPFEWSICEVLKMCAHKNFERVLSCSHSLSLPLFHLHF